MNRYTLVHACEWEGLYKDGVLLAEDHSVDIDILMQELGGEVVWLTTAQDAALCEVGSLPPQLCEVARMGE